MQKKNNKQKEKSQKKRIQRKKLRRISLPKTLQQKLSRKTDVFSPEKNSREVIQNQETALQRSTERLRRPPLKLLFSADLMKSAKI